MVISYIPMTEENITPNPETKQYVGWCAEILVYFEIFFLFKVILDVIT